MKKLKTLQAVFIATFSMFTYNSYAQNNALTLNGAYVVMNGGTQADNIKLVINQPSPSGIVRTSVGGHIHSENQFNSIKWITNSELGSYVFPFGIGGNANDYIAFTFNKTAGNSDITMSTWGTNQENSPKPAISNVAAVTNMAGTADSVKFAIDRFWDIEANAITADLTFSYLSAENTILSPSSNLMAQHWNGLSWDTQVGTGTPGVTSGVGTVGPIVGQTSFSPWVLTSECSSTTSNATLEICQGDSIFIENDWQTTSGVYSDVLIGGNQFGCDSIISKTLIVNSLDLSTTTSGSTISANATAPATYQWVDCNNGYSIIAGETNQSFTATSNGDYAVIINENGCSDTSDCVNLNSVGLHDYNKEKAISIYPNPTNNVINIDFEILEPSTQLKLINSLGKIVYQSIPKSKTTVIDIQSLAKGVYTLIISTNEVNTTRKIIKQ